MSQLELIAQTSTLDMATVINRAGLESKASAMVMSPSITLYSDTETCRTVRELRIYRGGNGYLETRMLYDFDPDKKRWTREGEATRVSIDSFKEAQAKAREMLQEIEASDLQLFDGCNARMESYYPRSN